MGDTRVRKNVGLIPSLIGLAATVISLFLPWFSNAESTVSGISSASAFQPVLFILIVVMLAVALVLTILSVNTTSGKQMVFGGLRILCSLGALYALMGVRKLMTGTDGDLEVTLLAGSWVFIAGCLINLFGGAKGVLAGRDTGKKYSTIDLVLMVMTAAIYAAALLTLSFIKLAPGTFLRPANALQAPFGILFGIPGCIGIAIGNLLSDLTQGTAPHVMIMGTLTNFLAAFLPYLLVSNAKLATRRSVVEFVWWGSILGGLIVSSSIFVNVMFGLTPKAVAIAFFPTTLLNQLLPSLLLGIPLEKLLYPFVIRSGLYRGRESARETVPETTR